jgi:hypothetical protein
MEDILGFSRSLASEGGEAASLPHRSGSNGWESRNGMKSRVWTVRGNIRIRAAAIAIGLIALTALPASAGVMLLSTTTTNNEGPQINNSGWVGWMGSVGPQSDTYLWNGSSIQKVSPGGGVDFGPQINNAGQLVWSSRQSLMPLGWGDTDDEIFLSNGFAAQQLTNDLNSNDVFPRINRTGQIVWEHWNNPTQIYLWNGSTVRPLTQDTVSTTSNRHPQINDAGQVVWEHWEGTASQIQFWNGSTVRSLTVDPGEYLNPQINNAGQVVWAGGVSGHHSIYLWNGSAVQQITTGAPDDQYPQINNSGEVAWVRGNGVVSGNSQWNVWFWNGTSDQQITSTGSEISDLRLNDSGQIVWTHELPTGRTVYLWNGAYVQPLATLGTWNAEPEINDAGQVVWVGWDGSTNEVYLYTPTAPAAPSGLTASIVSSTQVNLAWTDNSDNEFAFAIWRQTGTGSFTRVGVVPPNTTSFTDAGLTPGTTYTYEVRATNNIGASGWSNQATVALVPPAAPTRLTVSGVSASAVNLTWTDNSYNETAFAIWRQSGGSAFVRVGVVAPNTTRFTDTGLTPNTTYTYEVRATNNVGASAWSNQMSVTTSP